VDEIIYGRKSDSEKGGVRRNRGPPYAREATGKIYYLLNFWNKMHFQTLTGNHYQSFLGYG
jgi:hypothetical protein